MKIILDKNQYRVLDTKEKVTIADSFVVRQNKIGGGNGEAKLYIGQDNTETRNFFGASGFTIPCFLMKSDLKKYLEETKAEYIKPEQPYINKDALPALWEERKRMVDALPDKIEFEVQEQRVNSSTKCNAVKKHGRRNKAKPFARSIVQFVHNCIQEIRIDVRHRSLFGNVLANKTIFPMSAK